MQKFIEILKAKGLLRIIGEPVSTDLEIAHLSYIEVKKNGSKALLFTHPVDERGRELPPLLTNLYGSKAALELALGRSADEIASEIERLTKPKKPRSFSEKIDFFKYLLNLRSIFPRRLGTRGQCQEIEMDSNLNNLPILKTWEGDGGKFITMGQIYTRSLDGEHQNLGMYRLQVHSENELGMHWQIHKDAAGFFEEYRRANKRMPVTVGIGGDPLYIWCGQAPLPKNVFELMLYGFIKKTPAKLVKSLTNDIYVPYDLDYVIEGYVDPAELRAEGPFGDHTGFYTPIEPFPVMHVTKITRKKDAIFSATVVGKPPLEDKYMGGATERIFLPLLRTTAPELIDYKMPENGVFHNLILAKFRAQYPAHAKQLMHAFWGVGQMSFVKHAIFVPENAPSLSDFVALGEFVLNRFGAGSMLVSEGVCDQLDHASPNSCFGGKLGIDASEDHSTSAPILLGDDNLTAKLKELAPEILEAKQYFTNTKNPICVVRVNKTRPIREFAFKFESLAPRLRIVIFVDKDARANNPYMLVWRVTNNIDAKRDISVLNSNLIIIDATAKDEKEGYTRGWPKATDCSPGVVSNLINRGLVKDDPALFEKYEIFC